MTAEDAESPPERRAPDGVTPRAAEFWQRVYSGYDLSDAEFELLTEAVQTISEVDALKVTLAADGVSVAGSKGQRRVHPAVNEIRQHRMALARLLKQLDLPAEEEPETQTTKDARAAANTRWSMARARERG